MKRNAENAVRRPWCVLMTAGAVFALTTAAFAGAQEQAKGQRPPETYQTFYLVNSTGQHDANDIQTDLRNLLPGARIYYVETANALSVRGSAEEIAEAQKILGDLDRPRKTYRLTYTLGEGDNGHAARHLVAVISQGNKTMVKVGSRVPIVTGSYGNGADANTQMQYQDVGLNLDATLSGSGDGLRLRTKMEQTSVADEKSNVGIQDPILRQAVLECESALVMGKPIVLGSLELEGGKRMEVSVVAEAMK